MKSEATSPPLPNGERRESMNGKMTEKDKMLGGELYAPLDPQLSAERCRARLLFKALNGTRDDQQEERARLIKELIPALGHDIWIEPRFTAITAVRSRSGIRSSSTSTVSSSIPAI